MGGGAPVGNGGAPDGSGGGEPDGNGGGTTFFPFDVLSSPPACVSLGDFAFTSSPVFFLLALGIIHGLCKYSL